VFVIATHGAPWTLHFTNPVGIGLAIGSTLIWALYWIANTRHGINPVGALFLNFSVSTPLLIALVVATEELKPIPLEGVLGGLYVGIFEMGISFICWLNAMKLAARAATISTLIFLSPPFSLALIWLVLGEPVQPYTLLGLGFILTGLVWQHR
jgi:drug/metabolite transporter (DMT)-like permease